MPETPDEAAVLARVVRWAEDQPLIRTVILESSRAVDHAPLDRFSDYDILLVVSDIHQFAESNDWQRFFGEPLVRFGDPVDVLGIETYMRMVVYRDHTKIDFALWPVELLRRVVEQQISTDFLDRGYRVLLDKDGLAARLPAPTRTAHIPPKPIEQAYLALIEEFWWESTYVAKNLWRDDLVFARYNLDVVMRSELLLPLLEWRIELDHGWTWKPGIVGRGLKRALPPDLWSAFERTYVGPGIEENWEALFAMTALFRRAAIAVGQALVYTYPQELDDDVTAYLEEARRLPH
ncbi:MAG TPA: aminoglycoside 6-adenylyltransferase [Ktedonobacterales bacterium]|nr:aminoglycoside 6-adenylyltransferase [Ktedonobacterales bacterium]